MKFRCARNSIAHIIRLSNCGVYAKQQGDKVAPCCGFQNGVDWRLGEVYFGLKIDCARQRAINFVAAECIDIGIINCSLHIEVITE